MICPVAFGPLRRGLRAGGFPSTGSRRWRCSIGSAIRASLRSISRASGEGPRARPSLHVDEAARLQSRCIGPVRREGSHHRCEKRRLNPLGGVPEEMWTMFPRRPSPTAGTKAKKRDIRCATKTEQPNSLSTRRGDQQAANGDFEKCTGGRTDFETWAQRDRQFTARRPSPLRAAHRAIWLDNPPLTLSDA
jgi:hypothetical protein